MLPQEIEVWYIIPSIRAELVKFMLKDGLKQREIAKKLGLRESAVSQYVKKKRGKEINLPIRIKKQIEKSAQLIIKDKKNPSHEIQRICRLVRKEGTLRKIRHSLGYKCEHCGVCSK